MLELLMLVKTVLWTGMPKLYHTSPGGATFPCSTMLLSPKLVPAPVVAVRPKLIPPPPGGGALDETTMSKVKLLGVRTTGLKSARAGFAAAAANNRMGMLLNISF